MAAKLWLGKVWLGTKHALIPPNVLGIGLTMEKIVLFSLRPMLSLQMLPCQFFYKNHVVEGSQMCYQATTE
jgi:hypothetical protein